MELLRLRLLAAWAHYSLYHLLQKAAEAGLGLVVVGGAVTTVATVGPIHHKQPPPKPVVHAVATASKSKPPVHPQAAAPATQPAPAPTPTTPAPQPVTKPAAVAQAPQPVPATQPSPGSAVKRLVSTPPASSPTPPPTTTTTTTSPSPGTSSTAPQPATGGYYSTNWSGYAAQSGKFTAVSGSWVVPAVTGDGSDTTSDAAWVGIGGVSSNDLIQTGTVNNVAPDGTVSTYAFYELLPNAALRIRLLNVSTGDLMTASINEVSTGQWTITISDSTTSQTYTTTVSYTSTYSSAEWIEEDPSYLSGSLVPFDSFGHVEFSDGSTTQDGATASISGSGADPITLVDSNDNPIVTPSVLINSGTGFWATHD